MSAPARIAVQAIAIELLAEQAPHARILCTRIVVGDALPEIVMFNGDPYLRDRSIHDAAWRKVRPYRLDVGE